MADGWGWNKKKQEVECRGMLAAQPQLRWASVRLTWQIYPVKPNFVLHTCTIQNRWNTPFLSWEIGALNVFLPTPRSRQWVQIWRRTSKGGGYLKIKKCVTQSQLLRNLIVLRQLYKMHQNHHSPSILDVKYLVLQRCKKNVRPRPPTHQMGVHQQSFRDSCSALATEKQQETASQ